MAQRSIPAEGPCRAQHCAAALDNPLLLAMTGTLAW